MEMQIGHVTGIEERKFWEKVERARDTRGEMPSLMNDLVQLGRLKYRMTRAGNVCGRAQT